LLIRFVMGFVIEPAVQQTVQRNTIKNLFLPQVVEKTTTKIRKCMSAISESIQSLLALFLYFYITYVWAIHNNSR